MGPHFRGHARPTTRGGRVHFRGGPSPPQLGQKQLPREPRLGHHGKPWITSRAFLRVNAKKHHRYARRARGPNEMSGPTAGPCALLSAFRAKKGRKEEALFLARNGYPPTKGAGRPWSGELIPRPAGACAPEKSNADTLQNK